MKKALIFFSILLLGSNKAGAVPVLFSWGGEKVVKVVDFPDTIGFIWSSRPYDSSAPVNERYKTMSFDYETDYVDAGIRFKQFTLFFLPVCNYDVSWCAYIQKDDKYVQYSFDELSVFASHCKIILKPNPEEYIPF